MGRADRVAARRRSSSLRRRRTVNARLAAAGGLAICTFMATAHPPPPKEAQAERVLKEAMDSDYLETQFDAAEEKLHGAIDQCGRDGCTAATKARLFMALGTVLAGGKRQLDDAKDA